MSTDKTESWLKPMILSDGTIIDDGILATRRGSNWASGDVNIGNRIFTDSVVTIIDERTFHITPEGTEPVSQNQRAVMRMFSPLPAKQNAVSATIDGVNYHGSEMYVVEGVVIVK